MCRKASRALSLLPAAERASVLRYLRPEDAKMSLASALLKHYAVGKLAGVPWARTAITRDARTKPVYVDPATGAQPVAFNVSHQAGIVALVAVAGHSRRRHRQDGERNEEQEGDWDREQEQEQEEVQVGVDVVCTSERRARDHAVVRDEGWDAFVDMHADVFAPGETAYLKSGRLLKAVAAASASPTAPTTAEQLTDGRLRAFYALWALREAYVKMTGDALLADWLAELEFRDFRAPRPTAGWDVPAREDEEGGGGDGDAGGEAQVIKNPEIWFRGAKVEDVNMCLRSMGPDFMIATAVRAPGPAWRLGPYETISLDEALAFAESS